MRVASVETWLSSPWNLNKLQWSRNSVCIPCKMQRSPTDFFLLYFLTSMRNLFIWIQNRINILNVIHPWVQPTLSKLLTWKDGLATGKLITWPNAHFDEGYLQITTVSHALRGIPVVKSYLIRDFAGLHLLHQVSSTVQCCLYTHMNTRIHWKLLKLPAVGFCTHSPSKIV